MPELIVLRTYPDRIHADLARSYLESQGIDAFVEAPANVLPVEIFAEWGMGAAPHTLKVAEADYAEADALLADTESAPADLE